MPLPILLLGLPKKQDHIPNLAIDKLSVILLSVI